MLQVRRRSRTDSGGSMKKMLVAWLVSLLPAVVLAQESVQKPEVPVEKWTAKTILLIGAHADDDAMSHGTLAMLQAHGNQIYIVTLTTGNVGTQDPNLSRTQLAQIRREEELPRWASWVSREGTTSILDTTTGFSNLKIARRWWKIWCARFGRSDRIYCSRLIRASAINAGTSRITGQPPTWQRMQRGPPCGDSCLKGRSSRRVCGNI